MKVETGNVDGSETSVAATALQPRNARALLVLGMHRSGTSALTGMLATLGLSVPGELLPAEDYNEKGLFENKSANLFHVDLLARLNSAWDDPLSFPIQWLATPHGENVIEELMALIRSEMLDARVFAVKDPRMCRLVPLWRAALARLNCEMAAIHCLRHPLEVAMSLQRRDGLPRSHGLHLWAQHVLAAEYDTRTVPRSYVRYDELLQDWRTVTKRMRSDLGLVWPQELSDVAEKVNDFLSSDLRHQRRDALQPDLNDPIEALCTQVWDAFALLQQTADDPGALAVLDQARASLQNSEGLYRSLVSAAEHRVRTASDDIGQLSAKLSASESDREWLRAELDNRVREAKTYFDQLSQEGEKASFLAAELAIERKSIERIAREADRSSRDAHDRASIAERQSREARERAAYAQAKIDLLLGSSSWRATAPLRSAASAVPLSIRGPLRKLLKMSWWAVTPHLTRQRIAYLQERRRLNSSSFGAHSPQPVDIESAEYSAILPATNPPRVVEVVQRRFPQLSPLKTYQVKGAERRISLVTDSVNAGSLFGGVGTALIFATQFAARIGARLRVVTRTEAVDGASVDQFYQAQNMQAPGNIQFAFAQFDSDEIIDVGEDELFITSSWWTTRSTLGSVDPKRVIYLLQEDERMFYPLGDDHLLCQETLAQSSVRLVVNSKILHEHLANSGLPVVGERGLFFEPAFPADQYHREKREGGKKEFLFYARPNNLRNLYYRGIEAISGAIEEGLFHPEQWNVRFVGKDATELLLPNGVVPIVQNNLRWSEYTGLVRNTDLGLCLMFTPHPSYPPLDLAASGAVVVTNKFGPKLSLDRYSNNILCAESDVNALVQALKMGVELAENEAQRSTNYMMNGLGRSWTEAFEPVIQSLVEDIACS